MFHPSRDVAIFVLAVFTLLLSACGGGGGSGNSGSAGTLSVATNSLTFIANGPSGATPPAQKVSGSVTGVSSGTVYIRIIGSGTAISAISPVTLVNSTTGEAEVSVPPPSSLGVGTYTGTITVSACTTDINCASGNLNGSPHTVNVTYHVAALHSSVASLDFTITNTPSASDLAQQTVITGVPAQNWTASTNVGWLTVTSGGSNGSSMNATIVQNAVDGMTNGTYTGSVTLTPVTGGPQLVIPVSLTVKRTQVNYVSPYIAYSGTSGNVIIRGDEFTQVTIQDVLFGTTSAQSFSVVSPTEIHATYPATLPLGRHTVKLQSTFTGIKQFADLVVVNAPAFSAAALAYPDTNTKTMNAIVYDAERAALGVSIWYPTTGATSLIRFPSVNNVWQTPTVKSLPNHFGLAISADGSEWIAGVSRSVAHLNANDLSTVSTVVSPLDASGTQTIANLAVANDGTLAMFGDIYYGCGANLLLYDARKQAFRMPAYTPCKGSNLASSGDGSRLLLTNLFSTFVTDDVSSLNTASGTLSPSGIHLLTGVQPVMDRTGSRIVLNRTQVYDGSYTYLGALPATTDAVVLSPDGTKAYAYHAGQLITYDLQGTLVSGVFPQLGTAITLAGDPGSAQTPYQTLFTDAPVLMIISPDGGTVFIAGTSAVIVQPL